ncbi:DeoR family transcriptional regulator [Blautia producta]|uniref:DeoR family transcriptional regulator n=2 Tax=Blautia producta TaxID=33035 RepID=UPI0009DE804E
MYLKLHEKRGRYMLKEKRIQQIYELIKRDGQVEISELGKMFNVTEMTIRRDLESLSEMYHIVRTHGGGYAAHR